MKKTTTKTTSNNSTGLTRRDFLKATSIVGASFAIATAVGPGQGLLRPVTAAEVAAADQEQVFTQYGMNSNPIWVYVKNGRIFRMRPMRLPADKIPSANWKIKVKTPSGQDRILAPKLRNGKPRTHQLNLTLRRRIYDPMRLKYPMKRVDWSPQNRNTQNRGKSKFVRISWEEAMDTFASELKRVYETYGMSGIFQIYYSHRHPGQNALTIQDLYRSIMNRTFCYAFGGHTALGHSPDSWEGWVYGGGFVWGYGWNFGLAPKSDIQDTLQNSKLIIDWSFDPLGQTFHGNFMEYWQWFRELGIKQYFITPDLNWSAIAYGDKWIPVLPGTDAYLAAAIAHVWMTEGTYDKDYIDKNTYGFGAFSDYIQGTTDGVAKTPAWAEKKCGIKARIIKALAREWASKPTTIGLGIGGTICRVPYGHEITRFIACLMAMQGFGKPGRGWAYLNEEPVNPSTTWKKPISTGNPEVWGNLNWASKDIPINTCPQFVWKTGLPSCILEPPQEWYGGGLSAQRVGPAGVKPWFPHSQYLDTINHPGGAQWAMAGYKYTYPMKGYSEIHLMWSATSALLGCWTGGAKWIEAYQSPKLECIVNADYWWGGQTIFADILLPSCTNFECDDILCNSSFGRDIVSMPLQKCVEPMWESKSDFWMETELAKRLGVLDKAHEGNKTEQQWIEQMYNTIATSEFLTFKDWNALKGTFPEGTLPTYFQFPWNPKNVPQQGELGGPPYNPGLRLFANDPKKNPLNTKSGLIEFDSQWVKEWFPGDKERPGVPQVSVPSWDGLETPLVKKYPLLVDSPHPRFRWHTQCDENMWLAEIPGHKFLIDGYRYEALWMHPRDAAARGIKHGDIVRGWNDRGQALFAAYVTERIMQGVVRAPDGCFYDPIEPGDTKTLDKAGNINYLTSIRYQSKYASSMTASAYLIQVEKYTKRPIPTSMTERRLAEGI